MIKIFFIVSGLGMGGAEIVLLNLIRELNRDIFEPTVISLSPKGAVSDSIAGLGVRVYHFDFHKNPVIGFISLCSLLRKEMPSVVQTWMYHADLIGSMAARCSGIKAIAWSLHNLKLDS